MRREAALRIAALLALCLLALAGGILSGALAVGQPYGPPPGPPPPPPPPLPPAPTPPLPEVYPCALVPIPPELIDWLRAKIPPEMILQAARSLDDGSYPLSYDGKYFKTYINPDWSGIQALLKFDQLQRGAFIGGMKALVPFQIIDRGQCFPTLAAARSYDDGSYLLWMAHGAVVLGPPRNRIPIKEGRTIELNWFMAVIRVETSPDGKVDIRDIAAIIFYSDAKYHSPEDMLKAARSLDDGGILAPLPSETAAD